MSTKFIIFGNCSMWHIYIRRLNRENKKKDRNHFYDNTETKIQYLREQNKEQSIIKLNGKNFLASWEFQLK